jgi:hypothetical protein
MRSNERLDLTSTRFGEILDLTGEVTISFFSKIDKGKELCTRLRFNPQISVSFFNDLATKKKNYA